MTRKIVELRAENVKRLNAVEIYPDGTLVIIGGKNGAGKSSVLDSIVYALQGAGAIPAKPVRNGAEHADIELVLDGDPTIVVKRRIKADGKTTLEVKMLTEDGVTMKATSPQQLLDSLCGRIAFDPLAFTRLRPQDQVDMLRQVVGIDLSDIDVEIEKAYQQRTHVNRRLKETLAEKDRLPKYEDAPAELISVDAIVKELKEAQATNQRSDAAMQDAREAAQLVTDAGREARAKSDEFAAAQVRLNEAQEALAKAEAEFNHAVSVKDEAVKQADEFRRAAEAMPRVDFSPINQRLCEAESINDKVRANAARAEAVKAHQHCHVESRDLSEKIDKLRADRIARMNAAKWPVEGLGFGDDGVTFGGLPFEQASSAEQLRIATAIGFAQHPDLRMVMIHDGSLLDADSLAAIAEVAAQHDGQCFVERVSEGEECSIVIEDGAVKPTQTEERNAKLQPKNEDAAVHAG